MVNPTRNKQGKPASDNHTLVELGNELAQRRREYGIVQQDLAKTVGVSRSTLHTIEHGGEGVRWEKVIAVAQALNFDIALVPRKSAN
ncbi:helix-turn-helix domain-containing protein [Corynebacterium sp.]|uniref:helix-turn-helix transcriptional regulator n=1 Tax=Corynebacterium sp. TaxID=1720 RepID=UPI0028ADD98E|nr:helix-turn-helix domain-containing protein [Corynebacterium sp.]